MDTELTEEAQLTPEELFELEMVDDWLETLAELSIMETEMLKEVIHDERSRSTSSRNMDKVVELARANQFQQQQQQQHRKMSKNDRFPRTGKRTPKNRYFSIQQPHSH